ncbi:hypothetical protein OS493_022369 [Desmophyllum pertusum]|uniref:Sugar phosphate phosphatase n=1 Tax=Desmophyllum pertusum TaxID=174260 RepID=A0A9X0D8K5_9CNID|nr:hypothetical protein OS493_022369 [Desmophyllum pertusum]
MSADGERPEPLSGKDEGSFAYLTIRDRLPVILTKVIDLVHRRASAFLKENQQEQTEDSKLVIAKLSKLRYEMKTNKPLMLMEDDRPDVRIWNATINNSKSLVDEDKVASFTGAWLIVECYMYRKIYEAFALSELHQSFDPFQGQKEASFKGLQDSAISLAEFLHHSMDNSPVAGDDGNNVKNTFDTLLQFCLWGNRCDLSISSGEITADHGAGHTSHLQHMKENIIVDNSQDVWDVTHNNKNTRIDFILDNSGFELFTDLCFAEFLLHANLAKVIHLHTKQIPWFVSDASVKDVHWMAEQMKSSSNKCLSQLGSRWLQHFQDGSFLLQSHQFWTLAQDFSQMKSIAPDLYEDLSQAKIIFFKGDLNYRKLVGDRKWPHTTHFTDALWGFLPAPLCSLRTLKADVQVGLSPGQDDHLEAISKEWMTSGSYAVIQYAHHTG